MSFARSALRSFTKSGLVGSSLRSPPLSRASLLLHAQTRSIASFKLNTGADIPSLGIGTWQDADQQEQGVLHALLYGYRHIDGARIYGTEAQIATAISGSGVNRAEIFLTTKLWNNSHEAFDVEAALNQSLDDLETDYLDLYLMHWPNSFASGPDLQPKDEAGNIKTGSVDYVDTFLAMEQTRKKGKARAIGVSNFSRAELERLIRETKIVPAVHQMEFHPYLQQTDFLKWQQDQGIHVTAYSPFGNSNRIYSKGNDMELLINDPVLVEIGQKHRKSGAQVALQWAIQHGVSVIPKSKTPERIEENYDLDFELDAADLKQIATLDRKIRFNDPSRRFGHNFFADLDGKEDANRL